MVEVRFKRVVSAVTVRPTKPADCTLAAFCGDSKTSAPEQCDNGPQNMSFNNAYGPGLCTVACTIAPYCGDGIVEKAFGEQCDGGAGCFDCHFAVIQ